MHMVHNKRHTFFLGLHLGSFILGDNVGILVSRLVIGLGGNIDHGSRGLTSYRNASTR
jgi:hypothetical protein